MDDAPRLELRMELVPIPEQLVKRVENASVRVRIWDKIPGLSLESIEKERNLLNGIRYVISANPNDRERMFDLSWAFIKDELEREENKPYYLRAICNVEGTLRSFILDAKLNCNRADEVFINMQNGYPPSYHGGHPRPFCWPTPPDEE
jgi:hypothetical protein